ncbi:MAG: mannose-1-phosphate guanylyltransferase, partial [Aliifodinibius sp.]|nr:mannose-1-phosphate guanylyltransferase [Fodinibius sp.]NIV16463.1 mannose-1-phosphate guanylyltransferase [Fodinibius sp.]NIY30421.1 mannose-1-phosphate guanylyltransferase [Fodinibius sp.]
WNAGIFIWKTGSIIQALETHLPNLASSFSEISKQYNTPHEHQAINSMYASCENISVDYGIMEKESNVKVVPGQFGWSDLGSWNSLWDFKQKDRNGNVIDANALTYKLENSIVFGSPEKLIVIEGLENYLVADFD